MTGAVDEGRPKPELEKQMTLDEAMSELDRSERAINNMVASRAGVAPKAAEPPGQPSASATASPGRYPSPPAGAVKSAGDSSSEAPDPCATACRALESMRRSVHHVCGLVGEGDTRCDGARARVNSAESRVRAACPSCS